ncbi:ISAs1 family transposase [Legionella brunensis]|uniref:Transposase IS4 family protein n=1 Tax=Legionella brunensis TaxID=29422 RepID=A0A0W0SE29_9GAMM|nr:ISAs1 family transposase [Legionella brunensis]KTC81417.1 Transposase IS4 family protein [Legionella brunensis]
MGCQKDIAEQIVKQKGDYLLALKGNQGNFHEEVASFLTCAKEANVKNLEHDFHEEIDTGHGRIETRRPYAVDFKKYKKHMPEGLKWKN